MIASRNDFRSTGKNYRAEIDDSFVWTDFLRIDRFSLFRFSFQNWIFEDIIKFLTKRIMKSLQDQNLQSEFMMRKRNAKLNLANENYLNYVRLWERIFRIFPSTIYLRNLPFDIKLTRQRRIKTFYLCLDHIKNNFYQLKIIPFHRCSGR